MRSAIQNNLRAGGNSSDMSLDSQEYKVCGGREAQSDLQDPVTIANTIKALNWLWSCFLGPVLKSTELLLVKTSIC